jgi:hypothetical protein
MANPVRLEELVRGPPDTMRERVLAKRAKDELEEGEAKVGAAT